MRTAWASTLTITLAVLGVAGCGGSDATDTGAKTVTVTAPSPAPAPPTTPTTASTTTEAAPEKAVSAGPPLPQGVVGIDGRYAFRYKGSQDSGEDIRTRFKYYSETARAVTTCSGDKCSVALRMDVESGGSKRYTLEADPESEQTYRGTSTSQVECVGVSDLGSVPAREGLAVRATAVKDVRGRQVAQRIDVFVTTTTRCQGKPAREVTTLRASREP